MVDTTGESGMPARVRAWLDHELASAAFWAGRSTEEPGEYVSGPSVDELCAALPLAADQLERVKILGQLRSELYNGDDLIIGELYLAAQEFPERMDHRGDYTYAASSARKELGPDVVRWLRDLGEFGHEGIDIETAEVMVRALHMEEDWAEILDDWGELVDAHLVERTVWHDGAWRHKTGELVLLHEAEADAAFSGMASPEELAEWKTQPQSWPRPVKTDRYGPWVVRDQWWAFVQLKNVTDEQLVARYGQAKARTDRLTAHLKALGERTDKMQADYDAAYEESHRLQVEYNARLGPPMRGMSAAEVESAIELNANESQ